MDMVTRYIATFICTVVLVVCVSMVDLARQAKAPKWSEWTLIGTTAVAAICWLWNLYLCSKEIPL